MDSKRMAMEVFSLMLALTGVLVLISCAAVRDRAADSERQASALTDSPRYEVTLPNGAKIELVGLALFTEREEHWWRPDGCPLGEAPYSRSDMDMEWSPEVREGSRWYQIAFRDTSDPALGSVGLQYKFTPEVGNGTRGGFGPRGSASSVDYTLVPIPNKQETIDIEVSAEVADVQPDYYSKVISRVAFVDISLRPNQRTQVSVQVAEPDPKEAVLPTFDAASFSPDVECALGFFDSGKDCFVDFETGRTFRAPAHVREELAAAANRVPEGEAADWKRITGDLAKTPILPQWIKQTGVDMVVCSMTTVGTADRKLLYFFDSVVVWPSNKYVADVHWQNPSLFARSMARVEQHLKDSNVYIPRVRFKYADLGQPTFISFQTAGGATGILQVSPIDPLRTGATVFRYRLLRHASDRVQPP